MFSRHPVQFSVIEAFLANEKNKKAFVDLLITKLRSHGLTVRQANDDADTVAVSVTIELASNGTDVTVVASDTDIFVLLLYHFRPVMAAIVILTVGAKHRVKYRCIRTVCSAIGTTALQQIWLLMRSVAAIRRYYVIFVRTRHIHCIQEDDKQCCISAVYCRAWFC